MNDSVLKRDAADAVAAPPMPPRKARDPVYDEAARLEPAEFIARLDTDLVKERFGEMLQSASEEVAEEASTVADAYASQDWSQTKCPLEALQSAGLEVFEVAGSIKWFDASKGYGFIVPDNGHDAVLLHVTCLRAGGYQTAFEGARIHFHAIKRPKGMQAIRILDMDESSAIHPSQLPQRTHAFVQPESDWERAICKWFNRVRGFGFLTRGEGTPDVFVHMETLRRFGFTELRPGQIISIRYGYGEKGCMAAELRPDGNLDSGTPVPN